MVEETQPQVTAKGAKDQTEKGKAAEDKEEKKQVFEKPEVLLTWNAPGREFNPKGRSYFGALLVLTVLIILFLVIQWKEYYVALAVGAVAFVLFAINRYEPAAAVYELLNTGIKVGERQYRWIDFDTFFIEVKDPLSVLRLKTWGGLTGELVILFPREHQELIEKEILKHLEYRELKIRDIAGYIDQAVDTFPFNPDAPFPRAIRSFFGKIFKRRK